MLLDSPKARDPHQGTFRHAGAARRNVTRRGATWAGRAELLAHRTHLFVDRVCPRPRCGINVCIHVGWTLPRVTADMNLGHEVVAPPVVRHLVCRCHAPRDAMPRLRGRRASPPSPRLRTSRRMRVRGRWTPGIPRARRQRSRRRRRRGLRACCCPPSGCPSSSHQAGRYQPSCVGTRRGSDLARRAPPATATAAAPQASAARGAIQAFAVPHSPDALHPQLCTSHRARCLRCSRQQ